jgi:hypothetical protein
MFAAHPEHTAPASKAPGSPDPHLEGVEREAERSPHLRVSQVGLTPGLTLAPDASSRIRR